VIKLRKQNAAFYNGDVIWIQNTAPSEIVSYLRQDSKDEFLVLINLSSRRVTGSVELTNPAAFEVVNISGMPKPPVDTILPDFSLNGYGWHIYHRPAPK
jgi:glycosidase